MDYKKFKIIDAHCHIFPEKIAEKATKSTEIFYGIAETIKENNIVLLIFPNNISHLPI